MIHRKFLFGTLMMGALATAALAQNGQEVVLADEPDIYWTMGTLTDDGTAVAAEAGEDINGEPLLPVLEGIGSVPTVVEGIVPTANDGALLFDASEEQSLSIPNSPFTNDTPDNTGVTNRTYELWFQPRNLPVAGSDNRQIIYEEGGTTRGMAIYLDGTQEEDPTEATLYVMTTNLAEEVWGGSTGPFVTDPEFAVSTTVKKGETYHLVFVIDKPDDVREDLNGDLIGYLNGQEFGRVDDKVGLWFDHTDAAGIGRPYADTVFHDGIVPGANGSGLYFYDGIIDEFAVYADKSLTAEQVRDHYLTGVGGGAAPIVDFTADAPRIEAGQALTLSWEVNAFETLTINNDVGDVSGNTADGNGSITVNPTETATYTLSASIGEVSQSRSVTVFVGAPEIGRFEINGASTIRSGASATLIWSAAGETSVVIEPDIGDVSELTRVDVMPTETTTYTITATNEFGSVTADVTLTVSTDLVPDLGWSAEDFDGGIGEWRPTVNLTTNDEFFFQGGDGGVGGVWGVKLCRNLCVGKLSRARIE